MPKLDAATKNNAVRMTLRLPSGVTKRLDEWAARNSVSRTQAVAELCQLGLDGELAGLESQLALQQQLKRELQGLRGLIVAAIDSADTACLIGLIGQVRAELLEQADVVSDFRKIRERLPLLKQAKKND